MGYDSANREFFWLDGKYKTQMEAEQAANKCLQQLEHIAEDESGLKDKVFIVHPDGRMYKYTRPTRVS